MGSRPRWTDFHKNWHSGRGRWPNHSVQFRFQYFRGFRSIRGVNIFVFPLNLLVIVTTVLTLLHSLFIQRLWLLSLLYLCFFAS